MKRRNIFSQPVRIRLFFTYIMLFILPLLVTGAICYHWLSGNTRNQAEKSYQSSLQNVQTTFDRELGGLYSFSLQLSQTTWVKRLMRNEADIEDLDILTLMEYRNDLLLSVSDGFFVKDIAVCFHKKKLVLSSIGLYDNDFFFNDTFLVDKMPMEDWERKLSVYNSHVILLPESLKIHGSPQSGLVYLQSLPVSESRNLRATFIAFIDRKDIESLIRGSFQNENISVYIIGNGDKLIAGQNMKESPEEILKAAEISSQEGGGYKSFNSKDGPRFLFHVASEKNGWKYIVTVPRELVLKETRSVQIIITIILLVSCLMGLVLSYVLSSKYYKPIDGLLRLLKEKVKEEDVNGSVNEYEWLNDAIRSILEQEDILKGRIESDRPMLVNAYLERLLSEEGSKGEVLKLLSLLDVTFPHPYFFCMAISLKRSAPDKKTELPEEILESIKDSACKYDIRLYFVIHRSEYAVLCNLQIEECRLQFVKEIKELFLPYKDYFLVGIGSHYQETENLPLALREALVACGCRTSPDENVILYTSASSNTRHFSYPLEKENCMINCLKSGDYNNVEKLLDELLDYKMNYEGLNFNALKYFFIHVELTAFKVIEEEGLNEDFEMDKSSLLTLDSISDMVDHIRQLYKNICNSVRKRIDSEKEQYNEKIRSRLLEFVDQNYSDVLLSLTTVSQKFDLSPSYLSRFFKEQCGCNFLDYVNRKRIEKAKELLRNSQTDINRLLEAVGFNNAVTFRRLFRKYEGIAPSQYREQTVK